jgi:hypothetical protein
MICFNHRGKQKMLKKRYEEFIFVDFASARQPGFRNNVVRVGDVPDLVRRYGSYECYASSFLFTENLRNYVEKRGSVAGYDGEAYAPYLVLDVDNPEIDLALHSARKVLLLLFQEWGIPDEAVQCYFSGSKGFHIMIDTRVFGDVRPSKTLHIEFAKVREVIALKAGAEMDLAIKDKLRLIRIPNTINRRSGLYKIQISIGNIMELKAKDIIGEADKPRSLVNVNSAGLLPSTDVEPNERAVEIYATTLMYVKDRRVRAVIDYSLRGEKPENLLCEARIKIWEFPVEEGFRHNCAMRILSQFHISGYEKEKSMRLMTQWNLSNGINLPEREIISMVESVYSSPHPYSYGCRDSILQNFCPYRDRLEACRMYWVYKDKKKKRLH